MSQQQKAYIAGIGMITPAGVGAKMTSATVRAGISLYQVSDYKTRSCQFITMAMVPDEALPEICHELSTSEEMSEQMGRMLMMADVALAEVMSCYLGDKPLPMVLCGPTAGDVFEVPFSHRFFDLLSLQTKITFDRPNCRLVGTGRAGVMAGIDIAMKYLAQGGDYVLVGGVDSYRDYDCLLALSEQERLLAEGNIDGFAPGEGACFLLLTGKPELAKVFDGVNLFLSTPGIAEEVGHLSSSITYSGDGLSQAFSAALKHHGNQKVARIYSSMNGENFWAKEYGVAMIRNKQLMVDNLKHEHPADCYGDLGAATGAVLISLAGLSLASEEEVSTNLIYCSSDTAQRGAVCMSMEKVIPAGSANY